MPDIFVSYSRKDQTFVRRLHDALVARQREVWVDWEDIPPSADWRAEIFPAIESAHAFVFVLSPDSIVSPVCGEELAHAVKQQKRLIPIVCREVNPSNAPASLSALNWIFFRDTDDFDHAIALLIAALDTDLDWVKAHTRLLTRAIEWDNKKRNDAFVLRGADLRAAEEWLAKAATGKEPKPTALQSEYILASRKSATRQQRMILTGVTLALVVAIGLACLASILGLFAWDQSNVATNQKNTAVAERNVRATAEAQAIAERNLAQARELAIAATSQASTNPELSMLLALESAKIAPAAGAEQALRIALLSPERKILRIGTLPVLNAAFTPDGKSVIFDVTNSPNQVWDLQKDTVSPWSGSPIGKSNKPVMALTGNWLATSPDKKLAVTANNTVTQVWDTQTGKPISELRGHTAQVMGAQFSPDSKSIVTWAGDVTLPNATSDYDARVWDALTGKPLALLHGHRGTISSAVFSQDGKTILTGSVDGSVIEWNLQGNLLLKLFAYSQGVEAATLSPDGKTILTTALCQTGNCDLSPRVWEVSNFDTQPLFELAGQSSWTNSATFSLDSKSIVTAGDDGTVRLWDISPGQNLFELPEQNQARFSPDGKWVVTANDGNNARVWQAQNGKLVRELVGHTKPINYAEFSPDNKWIVTASADNTTRLWDANTGNAITQFVGHTAAVVYASFSLDSKKILTLSADGVARIWDAAAGALIAELRTPTDPIYKAQFSSDGKWVLTSQSQTTRLWDVTNGKEITEIKLQSVSWLHGGALDPGGMLMVTAGMSGIVRQLPSGNRVSEFTGHTASIYSANFSPDGKYVVSGGTDGTVFVWDTATGKTVAPLIGHGEGEIESAQFSGDGKFVITAGDDHTARIWEASTGRQLMILRGNTGAVKSAEFSADAKLVLTTGADHTVRVYACEVCSSIDDLVTLARSRIYRQLTCGERQTYLHDNSNCSSTTPAPSR